MTPKKKKVRERIFIFDKKAKNKNNYQFDFKNVTKMLEQLIKADRTIKDSKD